MIDTLSPKARSVRMRLIKSRNTKPELTVRKLLRSIGFPGYRLHRADLPGKPDIVFIGKKKAIFVHGCFWHLHGCGQYKLPKSREDYWMPKLRSNLARDNENIMKLQRDGWSVLNIWECEIQDIDIICQKIKDFLA